MGFLPGLSWSLPLRLMLRDHMARTQAQPGHRNRSGADRWLSFCSLPGACISGLKTGGSRGRAHILKMGRWEGRTLSRPLGWSQLGAAPQDRAGKG